MEKAYERFGHLQFQDEMKQHEHILQRYQSSRKNLMHSTSTVKLEHLESEYLKGLKRTGKKGRIHVDSSSTMPISPKTIKCRKGNIRRLIKWLKEHHRKVKILI